MRFWLDIRDSPCIIVYYRGYNASHSNKQPIVRDRGHTGCRRSILRCPSKQQAGDFSEKIRNLQVVLILGPIVDLW
jgi:hypothetical protein